MSQKNNFESYEAVMQMSPWDFDQSSNGWRKLDATKGHSKAAKLIREYISRNKDRISNPEDSEKTTSLEIMYFHIGQLIALEGQDHWSEAIESFNNSFQEGRECWNAYVSATIGFLENDIKKVDDAIKIIEASQEEDKRSGNIGIIKNFRRALEMGERDYEKTYSLPRDL